MDVTTLNEKILRDSGEQFMRAVAAGAFISLGAALMLSCMAEGMPRIVCGIAFSVGLWLVSCAHGELFTGNCLALAYTGYGIDLLETEGGVERSIGKCSSTESIVTMLTLTFFGNLAGALMTALAMNVAGIGIDATELAQAKLAMTGLEATARGVLCNVCVCLAVHVASRSLDTAGRFVACALPVALFVTLGFEHSVADMFILPVAGCGLLQSLTFIGYVTVGNVIGGYITARYVGTDFGMEEEDEG